MIDRARLFALLLTTALGGCSALESTTSSENKLASISPEECGRAQPANDAPSLVGYSKGFSAPPNTLQRPATSDRFSARDGAKEALGDFKCGRRLKIYTHVSNGVAPEIVSPGISFCSPTWTNQAAAGGHVFRVMEAAAFHEGTQRSEVEQALESSALRFSRAYNSTIFRLREADVKAICPCAAPASSTQPGDC